MKKPEIIIIAALAESNRAIAKDGKLPWHILEDSQRFQRLTYGHTVVVGRTTWEKDLKNSPLGNSNIIIVTSDTQEVEEEVQQLDYPDEVRVCDSVQEAIRAKNTEKIFIAGGASIYAQALEIADTWELTFVKGNFSGDTFFPEYQHLVGNKFELAGKEEYPGFRFETYRKILY